MKTILSSIGLVIAYLAIYMFIMVACQVVIPITVGGLTPGGLTAAGFDGGAEAAVEFAAKVAEYVSNNIGPISSISALLSLMLFSLIFALRKRDLITTMRLNSAPEPSDIIFGLFAGASANYVISLAVAIVTLAGLFPNAISEHEQVVSTMLASGNMLPTLIGIGLVSPIVEEILFRGMISYEFCNFLPRRITVIVQGILFGLVHLIPMQIAYAAPYGIYFGFLVYKTKSLYIAIAAHIAMNTVSVLLSAPGIPESLMNSQGAAMIYTGGSLMMFISSLVYFLKKKSHIDV